MLAPWPSAGGDGLGGGIYEDALSILALTRATVERNRAIGGAPGLGGSDGQGIGGALLHRAGRRRSADLLTVIHRNHTSTSDDDLFGDLVIA
jgi:hypothetical protein